MPVVTNAELASAVQQVVSRVDAREDQLTAWQAGTPEGGPFADGTYAITNLLGETSYFKSPARLQYEVGLLTTAGTGAVATAEAARDAAEAALASAVVQATNASSSASTASTKASEAQLFRNEAANSEANALAHRNAASASAAAAALSEADAEAAATAAAASAASAADDATAAAASAAAAATFDPSAFYTKTQADTLLAAKLASADFTWTNLSGKPTTFTPSAHTHVIADVTGLQTALDGKQAAGSYAASVHGHAISDVAGLQTALDGKQAAGSYAAAVHGHSIADVAGLQTALDGKQAAGSYASASHTHVIADVTGLQAALDGKQPAGSYLTGITGSMVTTALGYTPYNSSNPAGYITGITSGNVTTALGYTPANKAGDTFTGTVTIPDLVVSDSLPTFSSGLFQYHQFQSPHVAFVKKTGGYQWYWRRNDTGLVGGANEVEDMSLTEGGSLIVRTDIRAPRFLDSNNTAYYVDPASTSNLNDIRGSYIRSYGNVDVDSDLWVGTASGKTSSYIYMKDVDEGDRAIHCNSNRIGFLTQGGGWGSWCEDDGSWRNTSYIQTPIIYDFDNTGYYVDPASSSHLNAATFDGLVTGRTSASTDVNSANDTGSFSVRGSTTTVAAMSFHRSGAYAINMGLGTDNVFRIGGWSAQANCLQIYGSGAVQALNDFRAPVFYDSNDTSRYVDPTGYSKLWALGVAAETAYPGSINGDYDGGYYHFGPSNDTPTGSYGHAHIIRLDANWNVQMFFPTSNNNEPMWIRRKQNGTYSTWRRMLQEDEWIGSKYLASDGRIYGTIFYDSSDSGRYVDPAGESVLNTLTLFGELNLSASGINYIDHSGTIYFRNQSGYATSATLTTGGDFTASGNVTAYSDARIKKDVETISGALDLVSSMRGVRYTRIDSGQRQIGVIAQEMQEVVPEVVQQGIGDDDTLSVAYGNLVGVLIEAIKELKAEVEALKNA